MLGLLKNNIKIYKISRKSLQFSLNYERISIIKNILTNFSTSKHSSLNNEQVLNLSQQIKENNPEKNNIQGIPSLKQFIKNEADENSSKITQNQSQKDVLNNQQIFMKSFESLNSHLLSELFEESTSVQVQTVPLKYHIQTYGCQMNVNDSEIIRSILKSSTNLKFQTKQTQTAEQAHVVFINTCAIRESAQSKIHTRIKQLKNIKSIKILGLLGCMAERLKDKMFDSGINIICGPDAYRDLPKLITTSLMSNKGKNQNNQMNVQLSVQQTYADITPVRKNPNSVNAYLSIMRGCNNMCSFCIVPFVRGRERSRDVDTILKEILQLQSQGVKQITLLGQNVNSFHDTSHIESKAIHKNAEGFSETFKLRNIPGYRFSELLQLAAKNFPDVRFRFTSPHPKDFPDQVIQKIAQYPNLCKYIHLPAQSGNTEMLFKMRRNHTRQAYINLASKMRKMLPGLTLSTDLICGFCGQTEGQFQDTLDLIEKVKYENAFLFAYSMRQKTHAHRNYIDDVPVQVKKDRLNRMINLFSEVQRSLNIVQLNQFHLILVENTSKRDQNKWIGKTDNFKKAVLLKGQIPYLVNGQFSGYKQTKVGDFVVVRVESVGPRSLNCKPMAVIEKLSDYSRFQSKIINFKQELLQQRVI